MKLLEKPFTYTEAKKLCKSKGWNMPTAQDLENIDISFMEHRVGDKGFLTVWVGNESREAEKDVYLANLATVRIVGSKVDVEVVECNVLFLQRVIVL